MNRVWDIGDRALVQSLFVEAGTEKQRAALRGTLKQKKDGFTYINVSNDVINGLYRLVDDENKQQPPYREDKYNNVGAHITVIGVSEVREFDLWDIPEIGNEYSFFAKDFISFSPDWEGVEKVWALQVESKDLESLRRKYGLTPKYKGHDFHITIAIRKRK